MLRPGRKYFVSYYPNSYPNQEFSIQLDCSVHKKVMAIYIVSQSRLIEKINILPESRLRRADSRNE